MWINLSSYNEETEQKRKTTTLCSDDDHGEIQCVEQHLPTPDIRKAAQSPAEALFREKDTRDVVSPDLEHELLPEADAGSNSDRQSSMGSAADL